MASSRQIMSATLTLILMVEAIEVSSLRNVGTSEFTIIRFFQLSQMICKKPSTDQYDQSILNMMDEAYKASYTDRDEAIRRTNNFIFQQAMNKTNPDEDEKLLDAIDMMLPDCIKSRDFADCRNDLRTFLHEDTKSCREILGRVKSKLMNIELSTRHLGQMLQNFYYHWIPLARLGKVLRP